MIGILPGISPEGELAFYTNPIQHKVLDGHEKV